ncbi:MAG TPA: SDR family oxidoreductase [Candidatus Kapabacteria bacterium]|nr:SDR family oxidoreductase [Candidatus Kapabacteria bacterium]
MKLKDKVAIITGSASGIGKAIALEYLNEGAKIVFVDRDKKALQEIEQKLEVNKDRFLICLTDLTKKEDIANMVDVASKKFDTIDILVNHVGDAVLKPFSELSDEDFDFSINLTLRSLFWCTKAVIPIMMKNNSGKIINTASVAGKRSLPNSSLMCLTKHGVIGFTKAMAEEYGKYNINVNAVCPVLIETPITKKRMFPNFDFVKSMIIQMTPLGRLTTPEEIARLYVFLASNDADFMTGQAINFSGGFEMR